MTLQGQAVIFYCQNLLRLRRPASISKMRTIDVSNTFKYCIQCHAFKSYEKKVCDDHAPCISPRCARVQALDLCWLVRVSETQISEKGTNEIKWAAFYRLQSPSNLQSVAEKYNKMPLGSKSLDRFFGTTAVVELHSDASKLEEPERVSKMWTVQFGWSDGQCQPVQQGCWSKPSVFTTKNCTVHVTTAGCLFGCACVR